VPSYQVTRTPGGGSWVSEMGAVDWAAYGAGAVSGAALGGVLAAARRAASGVNYRRRDEAAAALEQASREENWPLVHELARRFLHHNPGVGDG
jgi:hypothetical protein